MDLKPSEPADYLNYFRKKGKVVRLKPAELKEYGEVLDNLILLSKDQARKPIEYVEEITGQLVKNGNFVEAADILFNEALLLKSKGKDLKYFKLLNKAFEYLFGAIYLPEYYTRLLNLIQELKNTPYYPFFLLRKAFIEHMHLRTLEEALSDYLKIAFLFNRIDNSIIKEMGFLSRAHFDAILKTEIVETLFDLAIIDHENAHEYLDMVDDTLAKAYMHHAHRLRLALKIEFEWLKYYIFRKDFQNFFQLKEEIVRKYRKYSWFYTLASPTFLYLEVLYHWFRGEFKKALKPLRQAMEAANDAGDEVMLRDILNFAILLLEHSGRGFSIYSKEGERILNAILGILYSKDWYLGIDHSTKVASLSLNISKEYTKLTGIEFNYEKVYMAGLLHDIGKLYVPWYILNKPARLTEMEWLCIKYHPVFGREIAERIGFKEYARYIEEHHERNNGTGYPYGKKNLPPLSQIIGIADIFEAATSINRLYKRPKTPQEIIVELETMKDKEFEAPVIEALKRSQLV